MHKYSKLILFTAIILLCSCKKEIVPADNYNAFQNFNRTIKFTIRHVYSITPILDSAISGASLAVYSNYSDFLFYSYPDASRITDSLGKCEINGLDQDFYYIRATYPAFAETTDSVSTPSNTTSFVDIIFY